MTEQTERSSAGYFAHFLCLGADPLWRRLAEEERVQGRQAFVKVVEEAAPEYHDELQRHWFPHRRRSRPVATR